jgi:hypothetical protein
MRCLICFSALEDIREEIVNKILRVCAYVAVSLIAGTAPVTAQTPNLVVTTNQQYIEQATGTTVDLANVDQMFARIFSTLPAAVTVLPTENYYYFKTFTNNGEVWGNFRLDSIDREEGLISFAYFFVTPNSGQPYYSAPNQTWHKEFSAKDGVELKKLAHLSWAVTFAGKTVRFNLNDVKQEEPAGFTLAKDEVLAGRLCDESGFYFLLIFNDRLKTFQFALDESMPLPDRLHSYGNEILVGQLSEFAFYEQEGSGRKVLFGVREANSRRNNYFDGPFDQLPDNFVNPDLFQSYLEQAYPYQKGRVKGRGDFVNAEGKRESMRISISAYLTYANMPDLWSHVAGCQSNNLEKAELTACIASPIFSRMNRLSFVEKKETPTSNRPDVRGM